MIHKHVGKRFESNNCGPFTIINAPRNDYGEYLIKFHRTGHQEYKHISAIKKGSVRDSSIDHDDSDNESYDDSNGRVYVLRMSGTNYFKIGYTGTRVTDRVAQIQTGNPRKLEIVTSWEADYSVEQHIHELLSDFQTCGEWFDLSIEDILQLVPDLL